MAYSLSTSYAGESLLSGFDWFNGTDLSNGFVSYQSRDDAEAKGLYSINDESQAVRLGVDSNNTYGLDEGRPSIRLESKESYNHGLFIADFLHMPPSQCGLWPAFWTYGSDWPKGGELDIIEGANTAHNNIISAHTADGCFQDESQDGLFSGEQRNQDCFIGEQNIGCGYNHPAGDSNSYGDAFNAVGGGVYAMQWDEKHIRVWHFARGQVPEDIAAKQPQPDKWGLPEAVFGGKSCDVDDYFKDMNIVININFCGDYGNALWGNSDSCTGYAATCLEYVANNPEAFSNAYWDVKYIDAYTWYPNATTPEPTTTTTMTSVSTTTKTVGGGGEPTPDPAPTNPANISDYSYLGCFTSSSDFDTFKQVQHSQDMTLERCIKLCDGKTYAGVVDGECSCAENLDPDTRAASSNDKCSLPCPGDDKEVCGGDDDLLTVYANVRDEEHPQPPPMAAPMTQAANERFVATVTKCPKEGSPVQTRLPAGTGLLPGGNSTVRPPVSGVVERNPPSKMSIIAGVVAMGVMMVM